jgi:hypothetical protein
MKSKDLTIIMEIYFYTLYRLNSKNTNKDEDIFIKIIKYRTKILILEQFYNEIKDFNHYHIVLIYNEK